MRTIDRYIIRITSGAFLLILASLTLLVWVTQALREIDLMTAQGQTIMVFLGFTSLAIPLLVMVIAPIGLMIAIAYVLNKLATDSEVIVMNSAGVRPWQLFRPFLMVTIAVSLAVAFISAFLAPDGLRRIKHWGMRISADVVANVLQPGRFVSIQSGIALRVGERKPSGELVDIFVDDRRDPKQRISITARSGNVLLNDRGTFLILENGSLQRLEAGQRDPAMVIFERYAFDLSKVTSLPTDVTYSAVERYFWELAFPKADDRLFLERPTTIRSEFHNRLTAPLYPIVFLFLTYAFLGAPRTTRQSRGFAIMMGIVAVGAVRIAGFAFTVFAGSSIIGAILQYVSLLAACLVGYWIISRGIIIEMPSAWNEAIDRFLARFQPRQATS